MFISPLLIIFIVFSLLSWIVSAQLKKRFRKYSRIPTEGDISGAEVAQKMLNDNGIYDVQIMTSSGHLSDHYNPANKTVNLSEEVYGGRNVSAAAVAAHECGHAIQHAKGYAPLKMRSALVPLQNISAKILNTIFIIMFVGAVALPSVLSLDIALIIIIACYSIFTLFTIITLPVEVNATQRALAWLNNAGVTNKYTHEPAKNALKWAAYTYFIATLSSLVTLIYYIMVFINRR